MKNTIIAVDFDGTIVGHEYPNIGRDNPGAIRVLKKLIDQDVLLILYTMRSGKELDAAVSYCENKGISFWGINENPSQKQWTDSPKVYAPMYIDDAALGCPLIWDEKSNRHMVNWREIEAILTRKGVFIK